MSAAVDRTSRILGTWLTMLADCWEKLYGANAGVTLALDAGMSSAGMSGTEWIDFTLKAVPTNMQRVKSADNRASNTQPQQKTELPQTCQITCAANQMLGYGFLK